MVLIRHLPLVPESGIQYPKCVKIQIHFFSFFLKINWFLETAPAEFENISLKTLVSGFCYIVYRIVYIYIYIYIYILYIYIC